MINAVVVKARCRHNRQFFGIRFEEREPGHWVADWAFAVKESVAGKEDYSQNITGTFEFDAEYPGCPHCHGRNILVWSCCGVSCWDDSGSTAPCPGCQRTAQIGGTANNIPVINQY